MICDWYVPIVIPCRLVNGYQCLMVGTGVEACSNRLRGGRGVRRADKCGHHIQEVWLQYQARPLTRPTNIPIIVPKIEWDLVSLPPPQFLHYVAAGCC